MSHLRLFRALLGGAGLAGCIALLAGQARAEASQFGPRPPLIANGKARAEMSQFALPPPLIVTGQAVPISPDLFGTVALPVKAGRYAAGWLRAARDASFLPSMQRMVAPARGLSREQQVAYIQAAVTRRIRWISDATEWGLHDYWASAAETLQHGAGDMEDRAIVKMQALRSLGVPARDLYLTMGKDKVGGPITVLLVRLGRGFYVLDDLGGSPIQADRRQGFEPMLTLGHNASWIHGRRVAGTRRAGAATGAPK